MERIALYMRVSTSEQAEEGDSIPAQRDALIKYAQERNAKIIGEYIDGGISGTKVDREELQKLLDDVRADKVDRIVFTKLDRWFRSVRHYTATQDVLDQHNVTWTAIWEPIYDTSSPQGRMIINTMLSIAQFEAENTSLRIRQVFAYKAAQGEVLTGRQPLGYSIHNKRLIPNEDAEKVRMLFEHFVRSGSIYSTYTFARSIGIGRAEKTIKHILTTEKYIGRHRGNPNYCPPIIDEETYNEAQRLLKMNVKNCAHRTYIFSGLLVCGECGRKLSAFTNGASKTYYRCQYHLRHTNLPCDSNKCVSETAVEKFLLSNIEPMIKKVRAEYEERKQDPKRTVVKIETLKKKIARLTDLYVDSQITMEEYTKRKEAFTAEIEKLQKEGASAELPASVKTVMEYDFAELYETMSDEEKKFFWRSILKNISFKKDTTLSFEFLT